MEHLRDVEERGVLLRVVCDAVDVHAEHGRHDAVPLQDGEHGVARVGRVRDGAERVPEAHVRGVVPARRSAQGQQKEEERRKRDLLQHGFFLDLGVDCSGDEERDGGDFFRGVLHASVGVCGSDIATGSEED